MFSFPIDKYRFYQAGRKIIATSTYAGKTVRGVAICSEDDEFSLDKGKRLAAARCNQKVAEKRYARALRKCEEARQAYAAAGEQYHFMFQYSQDAFDALTSANSEICDLIEKMR